MEIHNTQDTPIPYHAYPSHKAEKGSYSGSTTIAAKELSSIHDLSMYFKSRPAGSVCDTAAVAVVAATAAVVSAASAAIQASKRGRAIETVFPVQLGDMEVAGLDISQLLEIRSQSL